MEEKMNEKLFGRVMAHASGDCVPSPEWLRGALEGPHSVARHFCRGCGVSEEIDEELARRFAEQAHYKLEGAVPRDIYFESAGCDLCDGDKSVVAVKEIVNN